MSNFENLSVEEQLALYLKTMVSKEGSDIFFHAGAPVTVKVSGKMLTLGEPLNPETIFNVLVSMVGEKQMAEFDEKLELDFSFSIPKIGRFRGNAFRQRGTTSIVMRHIIGDIPSLDALGLPDILQTLIANKKGLIVICGATGSGKSTTLASMIDYRNENMSGHIITLEDPIEFMHKHKKSLVAQREIGTDTFSFEAGMRSAMREAPDVILMGEVRDDITMDYALKFANTGHLALSTLHANSADSSIERMLSFFGSEREESGSRSISEYLLAVVAQRLVPTKDGGKAAALEIMINTGRVSDLIAKRDFAELKDVIRKGTEYGMQTFDQALCNLYDQDKISEEVAIQNADSKTEVRQYIKLNSNSNMHRMLDEGIAGLSIESVEDNDKPQNIFQDR